MKAAKVHVPVPFKNGRVQAAGNLHKLPPSVDGVHKRKDPIVKGKFPLFCSVSIVDELVKMDKIPVVPLIKDRINFKFDSGYKNFLSAFTPVIREHYPHLFCSAKMRCVGIMWNRFSDSQRLEWAFDVGVV